MKNNRPLKKGDVIFVNDDREMMAGIQHGRRPYIVVSNNKFNQHSPVVNCVPLTTRNKYSPVHLFIHRTVGIPQNSYALCEQIVTVSVNKIEKIICVLPSDLMAKLNNLLAFQLAL